MRIGVFTRLLLALLPLQHSSGQVFSGSLRDTANQADYLIVTGAEYVSSLLPLAASRSTHQSLSVATVLVDSIVAQFPHATPDSSLREFVTTALTRWRTPHPQYLLLAGNVNVVPAHKVIENVSDQLQDSIVVDQWFGNQLTESTSHPYPVLAIGRFPAWTNQELTTMVQKTLTYEDTPPGAWARRSIAVADSGDWGAFESHAARFQRLAASRWPDTVTVHVRINSPLYRSHADFRDLWNQGCGVIAFIGHAEGPQFSRGFYFMSQDAESLAIGSPLALCLMESCSQGFERQDSVAIAVALLRVPAQGAVCCITSSGHIYDSENEEFERWLTNSLSSQPAETIGEAWLYAEQQMQSFIEQRRTLLGDPALIIKSGTTVATKEPSVWVSAHFSLFQNFPNPFNPTTTISYSLPHRSHVTLTVFNTLGQRVADLINGDLDAGYHEVQFNAGNLASGVYLYRLQTGGYTETRKLCVMK